MGILNDSSAAEGVALRHLAAADAIAAVHAPDDALLERPIASVHVTDLAEPGRYLLPRELVATNGLWLDAVDPAEWVARIAEAGASAVAFGLSDDNPVVPTTVVDACANAGLPLLIVDRETSFTKLSDVIAARRADDAAHDLRLELDKTRRLLQASVDEDAYSALARHVRHETGFAAAFVSAEGEVLAAAGRRPRTRDILDVVRAGGDRTAPAASATHTAFPVPGTGSGGSVLLVAAPIDGIDDSQRLAIEQTTAYAVVADRRRSEGREIATILTREAIELVDEGGIGERQLAARLRTLGLRPGADTLVVVGDDTPTLLSALAVPEVAAAIARHHGRVEALVQGDDTEDLRALLVDLLGHFGDRSAIAIGAGPARVTGLRVALAATRAAHATAVPGAPPLHARPETTALILAGVDSELRQAHANALLGPVAAWDARAGGDLVRTTRVFLEHDGRWSEAARSLGIHVNTLKHRLARVAELSGKSVDRTRDRVDLWIALQHLDDSADHEDDA